MNSDRVAIIAVHGIADQAPGETVRALARLLCRGAPGVAPYAEGETHGVLVPVEKLAPAAHAEADAVTAAARSATPGAASGFYRAQRAAAAPSPGRDLGAELTDYLLERHRLSERDSIYESTRIRLTRPADGGTADIFEMYWADLSRLRAGGIRALSALYQLFFHLNTLARDIVDQAALEVGGGARWRLLQRLHAWSAWLMSGPAALLQLAMLVLVPFGAASLVPQGQRPYLLAAVIGVAGVLAAVGAVLVGLRQSSPARRWLLAAPLAAAASGCVIAAVVAARSEWLTPWIYLTASVVATGAGGIALIARYARVVRGVRATGYALIGGVGVALLVDAWRMLPEVTTLAEWMLTGALHVGEYLLAALLVAWVALALVQIAALVLGLLVERGHETAIRASLYTARLGMVFSSGLFAVLSLVLWSVITYVAGLALEDFTYEPVVFGAGYRGAAIFLEARVQSVGAFFTPMVAAAGALAFAALLVLAPSLREELAPTVNVDRRGVRPEAVPWSARLGRWLSAGLRFLQPLFGWLVPGLAIAGGTIFVGFVVQQFLPQSGAARWLAGTLEYFRGEALVAVGKWLAGGALTITALGARFTQTFGRLRVMLDAVLDIDNYFADPLDGQPPRARIFARFASLLAHLRERGYARVVIVAHSQGTVISADLLRHLNARGRLRSLIGDMTVALVTIGSPLRDLYAARFPLLYRWMGPQPADFAAAGPRVADLDASAWVNAYRSGDYVGRAIWTPAHDGSRFAVAAVDAQGLVEARRAGDRCEFCLGAGGHTHYFIDDAIALTAEIDRLVRMGDAGGS